MLRDCHKETVCAHRLCNIPPCYEMLCAVRATRKSIEPVCLQFQVHSDVDKYVELDVSPSASHTGPRSYKSHHFARASTLAATMQVFRRRRARVTYCFGGYVTRFDRPRWSRITCRTTADVTLEQSKHESSPIGTPTTLPKMHAPVANMPTCRPKLARDRTKAQLQSTFQSRLCKSKLRATEDGWNNSTRCCSKNPVSQQTSLSAMAEEMWASVGAFRLANSVNPLHHAVAL